MSLDYSAPCDAQESSIAKPVEAQESLQNETNQASLAEQQTVLNKEAQRVAESTKEYLPEISFVDFDATPPEEEHDDYYDYYDNDGSGGTGGSDDYDDGTGGGEGADAGDDYIPPPEEVPVATCEQAPNSELKAEDVKRVFDNNFSRLDSDGDGYVSKGEIDAAMVDPCYTGEDAQLVSMLKKQREDLEELSNDEIGDEDDGVTQADIDEFAAIVAKEEKTSDEKKLVDTVSWRLDKAHDSIADANRDLYANSDNPLESINPESVKQGSIGDCYFLAAVSSLATTQEGKEAIHNMIADNGDGTYTVTFPGDPDNPVTVDAPTDAELGSYAKGSKDGTWAAVLEKAYGKYNDADNVDLHDGIPDGSVFARGLSILTGKSVDTDQIAFTETETTHQKLTQAIQEGRPVTAGINNELGSIVDLSDNKTDDAGLQGGHVYSVTAYDPETRTVTIRNPWGSGEPVGADGQALDGTNDGQFKMTLEDFEKNFSRVSYVEN